MQIKELEIINIGKIENETIVFNQPLVLFYGQIQNGKTTVLNCIRWLFGATIPKDIIRHGEKEAAITLTFEQDGATGVITRAFYIDKKGAMKPRPIEFIKNGMTVPKPAAALAAIANPFLLNQRFFVDKSGPEKQRFLCDLFGFADMGAENKEIAQIKRDAATLRVEIKAMGEVEPVEVERPDIEALKEEKGRVKEKNKELETDHKTQLEDYDGREKDRSDCKQLITEARAKIKIEEEHIAQAEAYLKRRPSLKAVKDVILNDLSEIEERISNAKADELRYEQYLKDVEAQKKKAAKEEELAALKEMKAAAEKKKVEKLAGANDAVGNKVPGLQFSEDGNLIFEGTALDMLAGSQVMQLSTALSGLYPSDLGVELIDGGESLGTSIFDFVKEAETKEKTILATIVGDRPATVPEKIGVFVVEDGRIK